MMMILDQERQEMKQLENCFHNWMAFHSEEQLKIQTYSSLNRMDSEAEKLDFYHLAVLDLTLKDGLDFAKELRRIMPKLDMMVIADQSISPVKYLTPQIRAASLILRPVEEKELAQTCVAFMENSQQNLWKQGYNDGFLVENAYGKTVIPFFSIYYFEAREKKVFVRTKCEEYAVYDVLEKLLEQLPEYFVRCHRSYIVNCRLMEGVRYSENLITLQDRVMVPLSRSYKPVIKQYIKERLNA